MKVNAIVLNKGYYKPSLAESRISFKNYPPTLSLDKFSYNTDNQDINSDNNSETAINSDVIKSKYIVPFFGKVTNGLEKLFRVKVDDNGSLTDDGLSDLIWTHVYAL